MKISGHGLSMETCIIVDMMSRYGNQLGEEKHSCVRHRMHLSSDSSKLYLLLLFPIFQKNGKSQILLFSTSRHKPFLVCIYIYIYIYIVYVYSIDTYSPHFKNMCGENNTKGTRHAVTSTPTTKGYQGVKANSISSWRGY